MRRGTLAGAAVAVGLLALPASAPGAVTFGNSLVDAPNTPAFNCNNSNYCTLRNASLGMTQTAPGGLVAPFSGVIVRWRVRTGTSTAPLTFRVIHPSGGGFTGAGTSASETPPMSQVSPAYPARLPIAAGDSIGLDCCQGGSHDVMHMAASVGSVDSWGSPTFLPLADGGAPRNPDTTLGGIELLVNADLEPDADGDGFGDETQDACPTNAATQGACPLAATPLTPATTPKRKCKRKKGGRAVEAKRKKCKRKKRR